MRVLILALTLATGSVGAGQTAGTAGVDATAKAFLTAFLGADVPGMTSHFADKVRVDGDMRFLTLPRSTTKLAWSTSADGTVVREHLADGYLQFFGIVGKEKWAALFKNIRATLTRAAKDGELLEFVKAGDFIQDLHLREALRGERAELDDAVLFVWRIVDGKPVIVAHFADY